MFWVTSFVRFGIYDCTVGNGTYLPSLWLLPKTRPRLCGFCGRPVDNAALGQPPGQYAVLSRFTVILRAGGRVCDIKLVKSQDFFRLGMRQRLGERNGNDVQAVRGPRRDCRHQGNFLKLRARRSR